MNTAHNTVELLAPAGNNACLHAAVAAGASAVYLGLDQFNARRNADNFTLETLADACAYAHLRGVRVYVTVNVEILPSEIEHAVVSVEKAYTAGADAFIVQDIGLATALKRQIPSIQLHASTQMNIHNRAGIAAAAHLGINRVTLARELNLAEITDLTALAAEFGMETECFAHGALCICYSGQCLMSSLIGGRSANRGLCAQTCRLPYELHNHSQDEALPAQGEHLLSPKDLQSIRIIDNLKETGVASLKIEGRMKSPDYVYTVTSVYREVLDSGTPPSGQQLQRLSEAFSRGFTTAYLESNRGNEIMSYTKPNNRGIFVGRVAHATHTEAAITPDIPLTEGDLLEFWTNRGHFAATVQNPTLRKDGTIRITIDKRTSKGDRVFRVHNAAMAFACEPQDPRIPVRGTVTLYKGQPARITFEAVHPFDATITCSATATGQIVEKARTRPVSKTDVYDHVNRLGTTPFVLKDLDIHLDDTVGIGFSQLHRLRTEALEQLKEELLAEWRTDSLDICSPIANHKASLNATRKRTDTRGNSAHEKSIRVATWTTNPSCARAARRAGAHALYVPLLNFRRGQAVLAGARCEEPDQAGYPKQCIMALPTIDHDATGSARETTTSFDMWDYVQPNKPVFVDNIGDVMRALDCGAHVEAGPHVLATNAATLDELAALGVSRVWLSPELTLGQIADLAAHAPLALGLTVTGFQELMITEHCLLMSQGACDETCEICPRRSKLHYLHDRKGYDFPVLTDMYGRSHLYNGIELDVSSAIPDLVAAGIDAVMVDATLLDVRQTQAATERILKICASLNTSGGHLEATHNIQRRIGTTTGHLFRGVQ